MSWPVIIPFLRPIEALILDPEISDILVNGADRIFIEKFGTMQKVLGVTLTEKLLQVAIRNIARLLGDVFCTRLSGVAPDAVVQRAMRHTSPETKRHYQLGMADQVRQAMEEANMKAYGRGPILHFYDSRPETDNQAADAACK